MVNMISPPEPDRWSWLGVVAAAAADHGHGKARMALPRDGYGRCPCPCAALVGSACFVVGLRGCSKEDGIATVGWDCVVLARGRIACGRNKEDLLGGIAWLSQKTGNLGGNGIT